VKKHSQTQRDYGVFKISIHTTKFLLILNTAIFNRVIIPTREMCAGKNGFSEKNIYIRIIFSKRFI